MTDESKKFRRSTFLKAAGTIPVVAAAAGAARTTRASAGPLTPTPRCDDGDEPTPPQTEGPYFTPGSPRRTSLLEPGMTGTHLVVSGFVFSVSCTPLQNVLLDFWQADVNGEYDNVGYRLRGHQFTDAEGRFELTTIVPGLYPGRTRHIHVKVQAPDEPVLTTQLYFPGEPRNNTDRIFDPALLMTVQEHPDEHTATFDFVLDIT